MVSDNDALTSDFVRFLRIFDVLYALDDEGPTARNALPLKSDYHKWLYSRPKTGNVLLL